MADTLKTNKKYGHMYAIIRYETDSDPTTPIDLCVTVKKVVSDPHHAAKEVERLNELNKEKGCYYFYQITRFEEVPLELQEVAPHRSGSAEAFPG